LDELWNPKQIVYLTADSNNLLETLNEDKGFFNIPLLLKII